MKLEKAGIIVKKNMALAKVKGYIGKELDLAKVKFYCQPQLIQTNF